jgi:general L-amino acid transport system permease protein
LDVSSRDGAAAKPPRAGWSDLRLRGIALQFFVLLVVSASLYWLGSNAHDAISRSGTATGFSFLSTTAGFDIGFKLIPYTRASTHFDVLVVGLLNTLLVAVLGIIGATLLGFVIGIARLSPNWIVSRLAAVYIEFVRNVPLLLWILFFYLAAIPALPATRQAISVFGSVFLTNRGLFVPGPVWADGSWLILAGAIVGIVAAIAISLWARRRQTATGRRPPDILMGVSVILGLPVLIFFTLGEPVSLSFPQLQGFNFKGGLSLQPELVSLVLALTLYTAAYIAEILRSGIEGVSKGQSEAAAALGLSSGQRLRLVVVPQAMRIIIPPLTSQYLNLTKNSSLATAIAFPDLVAVFAGTSLNQTGQAIEILLITAAIYLAISLLTSFVMNIYNARTQLRER